MPRSPFLRYTMFGLLYFTQGTILSYFTALNALYFLERGLTMTEVGIFGTIALIPFVIKIGYGMLSDNVNLFGMGYRKPYILIGLTVQTVCLIIAPFIDPALHYWGFVGMAFILQMGMALYDTCTDGLALDTTEEAEQGRIQGIMVGGRAVGVVLTASAVGLLAENVSWTAVFWLLAALTVLPFPLVLGLRETERHVEQAFDWSAFAAFKQKTVITLGVVGLLFFAIIAGANLNVNPFLETEYGISLTTAGFFTTVWGIGVVLGGLSGGTLVSWLGKPRATYLTLGVALVSIALLAAVPGVGLAWPLVALFGLAYGTYQTVYFSLAMEYTDSRIAASMYSILMAMTNIGQGIGMGMAGFMADSIGFRVAFVVFALLNLLAIPLLPVIFKGATDTPEAVAAL